jgi:hypothetical protein
MTLVVYDLGLRPWGKGRRVENDIIGALRRRGEFL